jgi:predicted nucleotidyltransferase
MLYHKQQALLSTVFRMRSFVKIWQFIVTNKFNEPFYIREIARRTNTNPKDVYSWVGEARENGLIQEHSKAGRTKYYRLNLDNQITQKIVELMLATNASSIVKNEFFYELVSELTKGMGVISIILYGSHARGTASEKSDVDLLVVVNNDVKPRRIRYLCEAVADRYARKVEPVIVTEREFSKMLHEEGKFIKNVMSDGVPLYGFEHYVNCRRESKL